jgi:demethylmenaquinone methyltransferase/2-methoxy-6-polyprenyl-1,4-benzoquinol methylase
MRPAAERNPLPGTRPAGAHDESEAARRIRQMFARIAPRYDLLNHLLSFGLDFAWRRRTARRFTHALERPGACVLDLCCGTGDLALALAQQASRSARKQESLHPAEPGTCRNRMIVGVDFAHPMLVRAGEKARAKGLCRAGVIVDVVEADALELPFADSSFDLVAAAFGFRNLANYAQGVREIWRVLRPGGGVGILEFTEPRGLLAPLYRFYFRRLLPRLGRAISGDEFAYSYLPESVQAFPCPEGVSQLLSENGFSEVRFELWTAGAVALHTACKPGDER